VAKFKVAGSKTKTYETQEPSKFKVNNPTGFGPDKIPVTIPKGIKLKVKEVKK
tara:strand:+ start:1202 stop:1360 length:159 start_codon:yes stop_codon:yes gene_type:complete